MKHKSIEEILNFTIEESIKNYRDTEQGNYIARYELLMLDIIVGRFKHHGHLNDTDYKNMEYLIWGFIVERGWARSMPDI